MKNKLLIALVIVFTAIYTASAQCSQTRSPLTVSQGPSWTGWTWANLNNIKASDDAYATFSPSTGPPAIARDIYASNFNFSIPSNATITGVLVEIERKATIANVFQNYVGIDGQGDWKGDDGTYVTTTETFAPFGGDGDLWSGGVFTPVNVNSVNWTVTIQGYRESAPSSVLSIDNVRATIYCTQ